MMPDDGGNALHCAERLADLLANGDMLLHHSPLIRRKRACLKQNVI